LTTQGASNPMRGHPWLTKTITENMPPSWWI